MCNILRVSSEVQAFSAVAFAFQFQNTVPNICVTIFVSPDDGELVQIPPFFLSKSTLMLPSFQEVQFHGWKQVRSSVAHTNIA